ncbi:MAG: lipocalin family protein [Acidobacteriota bacterium]
MEKLVTGIALVSLVAFGMAAQVSAGPAAVTTVESVDVNRYTGDWFEIARFPNRFQRQCAGDVRATYGLRPDGRIDVINRCRATDGHVTEAAGVARIVDAHTRAKLEVRFAPAVLSFLPFVWGDYWIIGLADDYQWAVVGTPDRSYLWILSRTSVMDGARLEQALARARANGFDTNRLVNTPQSAR